MSDPLTLERVAKLEVTTDRTAKDVASFIRSGLTVEHTSTTDGKERFSPCTCDEKPEDDTMDLFEDAKT